MAAAWVLLALAVTASAIGQPITLDAGVKTALMLRNGYVSATFDLLCPGSRRLSTMRADARGNGSWGDNVLVPRTGVRLELQPYDDRGCMAEEEPLSSGAERSRATAVLSAPTPTLPR